MGNVPIAYANGFTFFITQALVGDVELGTDGWIQNITGNLLAPMAGKWSFVLASLVMFGLRFSADVIESNLGLAPLTLLFVSGVVDLSDSRSSAAPHKQSLLLLLFYSTL